MDMHTVDIVVVGAGIAGATAAASLSADRTVALVEAEEVAGYHTTGRSAALWTENYGPQDVRHLTRLSRHFFEHPPAGFTETALMHPRGTVFVATPAQLPAFRTTLAEATGVQEMPIAALHRMVPALRPGYAVAAMYERDAFDMDVAALHQGFLRQFRARGGTLALRSRTGRIERRDGRWHVHTTSGAVFSAPVLVNAAGAWGDEVAEQAGVAPLGLVPKRRTGMIINPAPWEVATWPMLGDVGETWYIRPEARTRLMVSPTDKTPMHPHDVQPDELDVALAIDRMQQALDIEVTRIERSWAGLRTFTPDGSLALGWDDAAEGFFWSVGQGGYGIMTSPAAGRLVADMTAGRDPGEAAAMAAIMDPRRFRGSAPGH